MFPDFFIFIYSPFRRGSANRAPGQLLDTLTLTLKLFLRPPRITPLAKSAKFLTAR